MRPRYRPNSVRPEDHLEPASFGAEEIVRFLHGAGRHKFATFVEHLNADVTKSNVRIRDLMNHANDLRARLDRYEPRPDNSFVSCTPPPEASD